MIINVLDKEGLRLDSYLSSTMDVSRSKIQKLIKDKKVTVNGKCENSSYSVKIGDSIEVIEEDSYSTDICGEDISIDIIYEDEYLVVINKKSGMVVHPAPGHYNGTLVNALLYKYDNLAGEDFRPGIVHRLDKDTSGLMIVAKTEEALEKLSNIISERKVTRKYLAIVDGVIKNDTGEIDAPIGRDVNNRQKMAINEKGKDAITHFKVLERFKNNTLIECKLDTGRTHQIRVHMAYIGFPVNNDPLYGRGKCSEFGQMLHSYYIAFKHPFSNSDLSFEVPVPEEFNEKLKSLRNEVL